jgi:hypothetical protein
MAILSGNLAKARLLGEGRGEGVLDTSGGCDIRGARDRGKEPQAQVG